MKENLRTLLVLLSLAAAFCLGYGTRIHSPTARASTNHQWDMFTGELPGQSASIGGGLLAVGASANGTVTIVGAQPGMVCDTSPSDGTNMVSLGAIPTCVVTAPNTVTINVIAIVALTPPAKFYSIRVIA